MPNIRLRGNTPITAIVKRSFGTHSEVLRQYPLSLCTLAIESSCDDTSVAILERRRSDRSPWNSTTDGFASLSFHAKVTADNRKSRGIEPLEAYRSHQRNLSALLRKSLDALPLPVPGDVELKLPGMVTRRKPDFISVTQGPGMRSNLATGLDTAKGLAIAWGIPLVGVHHMQAHALTPRLKAALDRYPGSRFMYTDPASFEAPSWEPATPGPDFPFLTLLVSGGHSMLVISKGLTDHETLVSTRDTAVGEALDKIGREILPPAWLDDATDMAYARLLSEYAFPGGYSPPPKLADSWVQKPSWAGEQDELERNLIFTYKPPQRRHDEYGKADNQFGWHVETPFSQTNELAFSFSGMTTNLTDLFRKRSQMQVFKELERRLMAQTALTVAFEHLASRTAIALEGLEQSGTKISKLVVSGGVAANKYLHHVLRTFLDSRGFTDLNLIYPPPSLCTDNAAMIAWAGTEMFQARHRSKFDCLPFRKGSMDSGNEDGGILGLGNYVRQEGYHYAQVNFFEPQASYPCSWSRAGELYEAPEVLTPKDLIPYNDDKHAQNHASGSEASESYLEPYLERKKDALHRELEEFLLAQRLIRSANLRPVAKRHGPGPKATESSEKAEAKESKAEN